MTPRAVLHLKNVRVDYVDADKPALVDVELTVNEAELAVVAGPTGSGKSTLLGVVNGLVPRFTGGRLTGDVVFEGSSIVDLAPRDRAAFIGCVIQDPSAGFATDTVESELAFGMEQLGVDPPTMRRRVEETLDLLGIADLRKRPLRSLSGGQQQRVAIGSVLTMHPRLLVLDEPTSAPDPTAAEDVLSTLARLVDDLGLTVIVAEHRLERVIPFADQLIVVDAAGRVRSGEPSELLIDSPVAPPLVELGRDAGWSPLPLSTRAARQASATLRGRLPEAFERPRRPAGDRVLTCRRLVVTYGSHVAVDRIDLDVARGEVLAVMGRNGSGKSSLLWALQGAGGRRGGTVDVDGQDPGGLSAKAARALVGLVPQTPSDLLYLETVDAECASAGASCRDLLDELAPGIDGSRHPRDLSEGQRLALVLAIVLSDAPAVIELDEPTRGLDYAAKARLSVILRRIAERGCAVVVATHDVEFVAGLADRVAVLADGEIVSLGDTADVLAQSPAFAPQTAKVLGPQWLTPADVREALA